MNCSRQRHIEEWRSPHQKRDTGDVAQSWSMPALNQILLLLATGFAVAMLVSNLVTIFQSSSEVTVSDRSEVTDISEPEAANRTDQAEKRDSKSTLKDESDEITKHVEAKPSGVLRKPELAKHQSLKADEAASDSPMQRTLQALNTLEVE